MKRAIALLLVHLLVLLGGGVAAGQEEEESAPTAAVPAEAGPPRGDVAARERWLVRRLTTLIDARTDLAAAKIGVAVVEVDSGKVLFARNADERLNVASNVKLVTSAAALSLLGPEYRFRTALLGDKYEGKDVVEGNLYLRAGGDPSLDTAALWSLVAELRSRGIKRVTGSLVIDDAFFDENTTPPAYDQKQEDAWFRAPVGAASLNDNAVTVRVRGAAAGEAAQTTIIPASDYFVVKNTAVTIGKGRTGLSIAAKAMPTQTEIDVSGTIRAGEEREVRKRIDHPGLYTGATLRALLTTAGIKVGRLQVGRVPKTARTLVARQSEPLSVLVRDLNKRSNNFMAETLLKTIGAETKGVPGTWAKGTEAVRAWLTGIGLGGGYRYDNGSGLYDSNRFSPSDLCKVLRTAAVDWRTGADYVASLAIAGADGTLAHRMLGGPAERYVRAKTGTLRTAIALAGFAGGNARPPLAFAVLVNDLPESAPPAARALADDVAAALALFVDTH